MKDFTLDVYEQLILCIKRSGYTIIPYRDWPFHSETDKRVLLLRHDVDDYPSRALEMAELECRMGIYSSYYFRFTKEVFQENLLRSIYRCGHEIGYHYETFSLEKGDREKAHHRFVRALERFREISPIQTISPHGSPLSSYDNRDLWIDKEYKSWGITADVSLDTDFTQILYLTDTGRSWNSPFNRRDRVEEGISLDIRTTSELMAGFENGVLPNKIMINVHPQRWTNSVLTWHREKWVQQQKNWIKYVFFQRNDRDPKQE